jgi:predicted nucleic-acid-binding protein
VTAVDTNIIVRLMTRDNEKQYGRAVALFAKNDIFIPVTVILETEWVLRYSYGFTPDNIFTAFTRLLGLPNVKIQDPDSIARAIDLARNGLNFADALHLAQSRECASLATFDTAFIKKTKGVPGCKVVKP